MTVETLDRMPAGGARQEFERCCRSKRWVDAMVSARPFGSAARLNAAAERAFDAMTPEDWREAFAHHPKIGDVKALRERFATTAAWAGEEQSGATAASDRTIEELAEGNRDYERRFGYIFIVCATGKSADEMLALLRSRLGNAPQDEWKRAADEQRKITRLRIAKLLQEER